MALPSNWTRVTVQGKFLNLDGTPMTGQVTFTPSARVLLDATAGTVIAGTTLPVTLDGTGFFTIQLPATDDPDINPTGLTDIDDVGSFSYTVVEPTGRRYNLAVPAAAGTIDLVAIGTAGTITPPGAPTIGTATAGNGQATVTFTPTTVTGGAAITGYTVTSSPGGITATGASSPITVTGLSNGTAYTFTVRATNSAGSGASSAASNSVTPAGSGATVPGAPTIGIATAGSAGSGQAVVAFTPPSSNGGATITSYTATSTPGGITGTGSSSPITVSGLTMGTSYTFKVKATNSVGTGADSTASNAVTPPASAGSSTPPSYAASGTYFENNSTSLAFAAPNGVAADSLVVIVAYIEGQTDPGITLPAGWAHAEGAPVYIPPVFTDGTNQNHRLLVAWHRAAGAESGSYTISLGTSRFVSGQAHRFEGVVASGSPIDSPTDSDGSNLGDTATPAVDIITAGPNRLVLHAGTNWSGGTWTAPTGFTKRQQGGFGLSTLSDKVQATAGTTSSVVASSTATNTRQAWLGALIPAPDLSTGQSAVTLVAIDGESISGTSQSNFLGNGYFTRKGLTKAVNWTGANPVGGTFAGFDDPNFLLISDFLMDFGFDDGSFYTRMNDLGMTGMTPCSGNVVLSNCVAHGIAVIVPIQDYATPSAVPVDGRPAVVGCIAGEEPPDQAAMDALVSGQNAWVAATGGAGHLKYINFLANILNVGDGPDYAIAGTWTKFLCTQETDILTQDLYFFSDGYDTALPADAPGARYSVYYNLYDRTRDFGGGALPATSAETQRGSHYGSCIDAMRDNFKGGANSRPTGTWVESGDPFTQPGSVYITPAQMKWSVWSTLVHGARMINYFAHSFKDDGHAIGCTFNSDYFGGPGVTGTGIYAAAKEINRRALSIASVIHSPKDGYFAWGTESAHAETGFLTAVTSTNARAPFAGVDAVCKWHPTSQKHYILSSTREVDGATNVPAAYRMVDQGQTTAHEVFENRNVTITRGGAIPTGFCEFSDAFATAASYHCYRID